MCCNLTHSVCVHSVVVVVVGLCWQSPVNLVYVPEIRPRAAQPSQPTSVQISLFFIFLRHCMYYLYLAKQRCKKHSLHYHQSPPSSWPLWVRVFDKYYDKELTLPQSATLGTTQHTLDMRVTFPLSLPRSELCLSRDLGVRREDVMIGRGRKRAEHTLENDKKLICHQWGRNNMEMKWRDVFIVLLVWSKWATFFLNFLIQYDSYLDIYFSSDHKYLKDVMNVVIILNETCGGDINATLRAYYYDNTHHYE